jgi:N-acetyltransferase
MNFNFSEEYILENDKVLLRPLELTDKEHLLGYSIHEPEIWKFNAFGADGEEKLDVYLANAILQRNNQKEYPFIVFDKGSGKIVGSTRYYSVFSELKTIEIGYTWYGKSYQGTGINKNCKFLLLEFAFDRLQMERVAFAANVLNTRSINAMKSIGCIEEGVLRNCHLDADGNRIDVMRLSILKREWENEIREKLKGQIRTAQ